MTRPQAALAALMAWNTAVYITIMFTLWDFPPALRDWSPEWRFFLFFSIIIAAMLGAACVTRKPGK